MRDFDVLQLKTDSDGLKAQNMTAPGRPEKKLLARRNGVKGKVKLARRLRAETTMTLRCFADRLHLDSWPCVSNLLHAKH